ncbi:hypothetical protein O0235_06855 [Tepidiforma flava]|uniref:Uncharacterized protein n=1 Tax=Tepidiforma flava TaxID=3004094 RepID=A0ABY7M9S9_9CHLR|nr:hypothetical protein [Tepidiforma flava]WBL37284.1 hypothetical protein O0235_06855 [Tepidiforma flava]
MKRNADGDLIRLFKEVLEEVMREEFIARPRIEALKRVANVDVFCPVERCALARGELAWPVVEIAGHLAAVHGWEPARIRRWVERQAECPVCLGTGAYPYGRAQRLPLGECLNCEGTGRAVEGCYRFAAKTRRSYWRRHFKAEPPYRIAWRRHAEAEGVLPIEPY